MTQRARGNNNIVSIFDPSKMAEAKKSLSQHRGREPVTVRVESVTARICLNKPLWRFVSGMCPFSLRDNLRSLGIGNDDWYLSEDQSLVVMADSKEFPYIRNNIGNLLLRLYRNSPEHQAPLSTAP